jgi:DNA-binding NtrC family response regulator
MKSLLVIDDDERIRKVIKIQLKDTDYKVFEADDKNTAMELIRDNPIDIVICDIKMKESNGFEILKEIKQLYPELPVIMLTGFIDKKMSDDAKEMGCFDFITKPVRREKLIQTIDSAF